MKLASLISGGKDSIYSTYLAMKEGHEIKYLVTMFPKKSDSWMFHHPCVELTKLQAKAMGIKQIVQETSGEKEKELDDLKKALTKIKNEINGIVSGAVASNYQKVRVDNVCEQLKLKSLAPLWHKNPEELWKDVIQSGFEIIITAVATLGLDKSWLGRQMDATSLTELKQLSERYKFHLFGEGGEFESLVVSCPMFNEKIKILSSRKIWDSKTNSGYLEVSKAKLVPRDNV